MAIYHRVSWVDSSGNHVTRIFEEGEIMTALRCARIEEIINGSSMVTLEDFLED